MPTQAPITETGCYLDNHRGHYLARDVIQLAQGFGFMIDPFAQWAIDGYDDHSHEEGYPAESILELSEEAVAWLNSGQDDCADCGGSGIGPQSGEYFTRADDPDRVKRCKACSGSGQAPRVGGQNFPPRVPAGHVWDWNDGDFGLYVMDEDGEVIA
jgi:hypothetical protein